LNASSAQHANNLFLGKLLQCAYIAVLPGRGEYAFVGRPNAPTSESARVKAYTYVPFDSLWITFVDATASSQAGTQSDRREDCFHESFGISGAQDFRASKSPLLYFSNLRADKSGMPNGRRGRRICTPVEPMPSATAQAGVTKHCKWRLPWPG